MSEGVALLEVREPSARYLAAEPLLLRGLDHLSAASDYATRLRRLILSLAVQGQLLPQAIDDEPASALLKRIASERDRLSKAGKIKRSRESARATTGEHSLPAGWSLATLSELCVVVTDGDHLPPPRTESGVPFLVIGDVRDGKVTLEAATRFVSRDYFDAIDWTRRPLAGDILYTTVGSIGIAVLVSEQHDFCFQRHIGLLRPGLPQLQRYLGLALQSSVVLAQVIAGATGIAQKTVSLAALRAVSVPLPPLAEQHRIVGRVEELMKLCDALEAQGRLADEQHARLTTTLFGLLAASESPQALADHWQRIAEHFDLLLDRPEAIDALEQTILQLAVRGLLVPQDPSDEPATQFVRPHRGTAAEGATLPHGWLPVSFTDVCSVSGGSTPSKARADFWDGQVPWVSPKDMKVPLIGDSIDHVSPKALVDTSLSLVQPGSVLVVVRGMILAHSFPVAITTAPVTINQDMKALTPRIDGLAPYLALVCRGFKAEILSMVDRSTHGTCKLESSKLFGWKFGLPPLAEQHRIVARVDELRRLCAQLRERLTAARQTQTRLADALVAQALG